MKNKHTPEIIAFGVLTVCATIVCAVLLWLSWKKIPSENAQFVPTQCTIQNYTQDTTDCGYYAKCFALKAYLSLPVELCVFSDWKLVYSGSHPEVYIADHPVSSTIPCLMNCNQLRINMDYIETLGLEIAGWFFFCVAIILSLPTMRYMCEPHNAKVGYEPIS